jgi:hypothetical protein
MKKALIVTCSVAHPVVHRLLARRSSTSQDVAAMGTHITCGWMRAQPAALSALLSTAGHPFVARRQHMLAAEEHTDEQDAVWRTRFNNLSLIVMERGASDINARIR